MEINISDERYEEIKRAIVETFARYNVTCVPVNGFELATKMGIKVKPYSAYPPRIQAIMRKKSEDGFCAENEFGEWCICYNDSLDYGRINNTIMHEIGHIVLDHSEDSELAEKEVRFFAKYALVPPVLIHRLKLDKPMEIARVFEVSLEAATYAFNYYKKWLAYGPREYTDYELVLLNLFQVA